MTLQQLEAQLLALSPEEKATAIELLKSSLEDSWTGISKTPGVMGGEACIRKTRIAVWILQDLRQQGATDTDLIRNFGGLTTTDLRNAWNYVDAHPSEIEHAISKQESA